MAEEEHLQPNLDKEEPKLHYGQKETEPIFDQTLNHHYLPNNTGLTTASGQEESKLSVGQQETAPPFIAIDMLSLPASVSEPPGTAFPIPESNSDLMYSGETQEANHPPAVTPLWGESSSNSTTRGGESTTVDHKPDYYVQHSIRHSELKNCTVNFNVGPGSYPGPSCQPPADPSSTCNFSELFQDTTWEILTLLESSGQDDRVLHRATGLSPSDPDARIYPEAKDVKKLKELFLECSKRNRWNWMDFDALDHLLLKQKEALHILNIYRQKLYQHLDDRLTVLKEAPPHDESHILDLKDRCDDCQIRLRDIITHKEKVAKSLKVGVEVFTLSDVYKGCVVFRYVIHSAIISENVRQTLLKKGGQEGSMNGRSTVTLHLQSDGCVCTHDAIPEHYDRDEVKIRDEVTAIATEKCKKHGAECIETSQISYRKNLKGKYLEEGTESEVICSLTVDDEEGKGQLSLRPDLTVPFARYLASNKLTQLKRYEFGKVFSKQRDTMGQCMKEEFVIDFDIAGEYDVMVSDAECVRLVFEVLEAVEVGDFIIRVNHVKLLEGILSQSGIKGDVQRVMHYLANCDDVCQCLIANGQSREVAEKVTEYLKLKGDSRVIDSLRRDGKLKNILLIQDGLDEMSALLNYCRAFGVIDKVHIDLGLFRAYKYYTGMMFQAFATDGRLGEISLTSGGRYDNLVNQFNPELKVPCVGFTLDVMSIVDLKRKRKGGSVHPRPLASRQTSTSTSSTPTSGRWQLGGVTSSMRDEKLQGDSTNTAVSLPKSTPQISKEDKDTMRSSLKAPKGTRDFAPQDMMLRQKMTDSIKVVFKSHGAVTIDTPALELTDTLKEKYGEESKLIYDLDDQGGERQSLRYDLTVPFARYLATNRKRYMKRYQIDKVYRRDKPSVRQGRYREICQCDFDIAGEYDPMLPDAECLRIVSEILSLPELQLGDFVIRINHRKLLDGMFKACGVPQDKFRTICSAVDKMDKSSWESVRKEIIAKGVDEEAAEKIGEYVTRTTGGEILKELQEDALLMKTSSAAEGVEDLILLRQYCKFFGVLPKVKVDLSLARGLDYYTGVIFEASLLGTSEEVTEFGSLCGGGRYDDLVKRFDPKGQFQVPCVGFSIGLDRLFDIVDKKSKAGRVRTVETDVYVISGPKDLLTDRMSLCAELWDHGINAEMSYKGSVKLLTQFQHCEKEDIPFQVIVGEEEKKSESVKIRKTVNKEECIVKRREVVHHLKKKLQEYHSECH